MRMAELPRILRQLVVVIGSLFVTGCAETLFVPMELAPYDVRQTQNERRSMGQPRLHIQTHPDGLGWTVSLSQPHQNRTITEEQEVWAGYLYGRSSHPGRRVLLPLSAVFGCPGSLIARVVSWGGHLFGVLDNYPTWKQMYQFCLVPLHGLDPALETWTTQPQGTHEVTTFTTVMDQPVTVGSVQLRWISPSSDPIGIEYPLDGSSLDIRLRDLAQLLQPTPSSSHRRTGYLQLRWHGDDGNTVTQDLSTVPHTLTAALLSDLVRQPQSIWPKEIRLRLASNDPAIGRLAEQTAMQLHIPVVTRTTGFSELQTIQRREVSPLHAETLNSSIGQWIGATVVLQLQVTADRPEHCHIRALAIDVETSTVLGQVTMEGPTPITADFEGLIRSELEALLRPVSRRQGVLIEEQVAR